MTIYNFNLAIGWASSGVEYAQAYRANLFNRLNIDCKFIFSDLILHDNIQHMTSNIGFRDEDIIWLYTYFTDIKIAPTSYTVEDVLASIEDEPIERTENEGFELIVFPNNKYIRCYYAKNTDRKIQKVEFVSNNILIRKDYYSYTRVFSEYYAPKDNQAHAYLRRFYNEDGSTAYEEIVDGDQSVYRFEDQILYSKDDFVTYFIRCLNIQADDILIVDREQYVVQPVLDYCGHAKVGVVVHADHFSENSTDDENILWNNYYEYDFMNSESIDFYISSTEAQSQLLRQQFKQYYQLEPNCVTIPVGSLDELKYPKKERKPYSMVTASRLADEKHIDWLIRAVVQAKETLPELTLDIYGEGTLRRNLQDLINEKGAGEYIRLMGHHNLEEVYAQYEIYLAGSTSEGFGLSLLEAIGSGLPIIGFDVRYGNQTFIEDGRNGHLLPFDEEMTLENKIDSLVAAIIKAYQTYDLSAMHEHSYKVASNFLTSVVEQQWLKFVEEVQHA